MRPHIFLGGIPGTGKTTLAELCAQANNFERVGAGQLIKSARHELSTHRTRVVDLDAVSVNQHLLVSSFREFCRSAMKPVLLDGHFVVPSESGLHPVAVEILRALELDALAVVYAEPSIIAQRLHERTDPARWWDRTVEQLRAFQEKEISTARDVAVTLDLELRVIRYGESYLLASLLEATSTNYVDQHS